MTRQYKSRFEELTDKDKLLNREIDANNVVIENLQEEYTKLEQSKQEIEKVKLEEIQKLKKQIDDMS